MVMDGVVPMAALTYVRDEKYDRDGIYGLSCVFYKFRRLSRG